MSLERARFSRGREGLLALLLGSMLVGAACTTGPTPTGAAGSASTSGSAAASQDVPSLSNVSLEAAGVVHQVIGPSGGIVETTDAKGTNYTLSIPDGALSVDTRITAVPITAITGLPKEAEVAGGVHFLPEGLTFWAPADLTITFASAPTGGVMPFSYVRDLGEPHRYPAIVDGKTVTIGIVHFSGYALLQATAHAQDAAAIGLTIPWSPPAGPADLALSVIAAALSSESLTPQAASTNAAMQTWFETGLRPLVLQFRTLGPWSASGPWQDASNEVRSSFLLWQYLEKLLILSGVPIDPALAARIPPLAISAATHALTVTNTGCSSSTSGMVLWRIIDQFGWQGWAVQLGVANQDPTLRLPFVKEHLCAKVVFDPNGGTDFPTGLSAGQTGTLTVHAGVAVDGGQPRYDWPFNITVVPHGADPNAVVNATTSATGMLSRQFRWAVGAAELRLDVKACIQSLPTGACAEAFVVRGAPATILTGQVTVQAHRVWQNGLAEDTKITATVTLEVRGTSITVLATGNGRYTADQQSGPDDVKDEQIAGASLSLSGAVATLTFDIPGVQLRDVSGGVLKGTATFANGVLVSIDFARTYIFNDDRPKITVTQTGQVH